MESCAGIARRNASRLIIPTIRVLTVVKNVSEKMWEKLLLVLNQN